MSDNSWLTSVDGLPPAGIECEYRSGSLSPWHWCRVVHHSKCSTWIVTKSDDRIIRNDLCDFRPIKTEREIAIEEMTSLMIKHDVASYQFIAQIIYDAGYRKNES